MSKARKVLVESGGSSDFVLDTLVDEDLPSSYSPGNWDEAFSWGDHAAAGYGVLGTGAGTVRTNSQNDARFARPSQEQLWNGVQRFIPSALRLVGGSVTPPDVRFDWSAQSNGVGILHWPLTGTNRSIDLPDASGTVALTGDFGFGDTGGGAAFDNLNNAGDVTQVFTANSGADNSPFVGVGVGINIARMAGRNIQILGQSAGSDPIVYYREQGGGSTWTDWVEFWHSGNLPYATATVSLGGNFGSGGGSQVKCVRVGDQVTITAVGVLTHTSSDTPTSSAGVIPAQFRPNHTIPNIYTIFFNDPFRVQVTDAGTLSMLYPNSRTNTQAAFSLTYCV